MRERASDLGGGDGWLEYLTGAHATKPGFYGEWRHTREGLLRSLSALGEISSALCRTTEGSDALAQAVAAAVSRQCNGCIVTVEYRGRVVARLSAAHSVTDSPSEVSDSALVPIREHVYREGRALAGVPAGAGRRYLDVFDALEEKADIVAIALPMATNGRVDGMMLLEALEKANLDSSDVVILSILSNQAGVALGNASLYETTLELARKEREGRARAEKALRDLEAANGELKRTRVRLEDALKRRILDEERSRIAAELHDHVVQYLVSIGMHVERCRRALGDGRMTLTDGVVPSVLSTDMGSEARVASEDVETHLEIIRDLGRAALARVRGAVFELSCAGTSWHEIAASLRQIVESLPGETLFRLRASGEDSELPLDVASALFHVAQEAVFNVARHSHARHALVSLEKSNREVRMVVFDDGDGDGEKLSEMLSSALLVERHVATSGLVTMARRVAAIGGALSIGTRKRGGVRLELRVPLGQG